MKRIYTIWGGLFGFDGFITGTAMKQLEAVLAKYGPVKSYMQQSTGKLCDDVVNQTFAKDQAIIIGHSGGGVMATVACQKLRLRSQDVALLITLDGSPAANMQPVKDNVQHVLDICNPQPQQFLFWPLGAGITPTENKSRHEVIHIAAGHIGYPADPRVMELVENSVKRL